MITKLFAQNKLKEKNLIASPNLSLELPVEETYMFEADGSKRIWKAYQF